MKRHEIAKKMYEILESKVYCKNVMEFSSKIKKKNDTNTLTIDKIPLSFMILDYNDPNDNEWKTKLIFTFDFMTEANQTGFEYFPYLYGVLDCHDGENSKLFIFYEKFTGILPDLIKSISHQSEWYDICFQLIMIDYYIVYIHKHEYCDCQIQNYLYKKLSSPRYQNYELGEYKFTINHKYLLVLWDFTCISEKNVVVDKLSGVEHLMDYLVDHKQEITILPSLKVSELLKSVKDDPINTPKYLDICYNKSELKKNSE